MALPFPADRTLGGRTLKTGSGACGRDDQDSVRSAHDVLSRGAPLPRSAAPAPNPGVDAATTLGRPCDALPRDDRHRSHAFASVVRRTRPGESGEIERVFSRRSAFSASNAHNRN